MEKGTPEVTQSDDDDNAELFSAVLAVLSKDRLPALAASVRRRSHVSPLDGNDSSEQDPTLETPIYGSYHVIFPLTFQDGARWLAKIPITGVPGKWDAVSSYALTAEANTMRLLRRETTISLPDIFDFSTTTDNQLQCPYILMSYIPGKPLYDVWFGHRLSNTISLEMATAHRVRALEGIASAMMQLNNFSFQSGGFITFDSNGNPSGIGPMRFVDHKAMLDRWFVHGDPADDPIYVESEAFGHPKDYFTFFLDRYEDEDKPFPRGVMLLLRQLLSCIPTTHGTLEPFTLAHPDFNIQNFLVSETGELQGIIDWDGVAAVPRTVGADRYPGWLTRDWDPMMYGYKETMDDGVEPEGVWEDSPATLRHYRSLYRELISQAHSRKLAVSPGAVDPGWDFTRLSLITENLAIATQDPQCRDDIVTKIVEEISAVSDGDNVFNFMDLVEGLAEGNVDDSTIQKLKQNFMSLLLKEGL